jgi:hypothetical protein
MMNLTLRVVGALALTLRMLLSCQRKVCDTLRCSNAYIERVWSSMNSTRTSYALASVSAMPAREPGAVISEYGQLNAKPHKAYNLFYSIFRDTHLV